MSTGLDDHAHRDVHGIYLVLREGHRFSSLDVHRFVRQNPATSVSFDPAENSRIHLIASDGKLNEKVGGEEDNWLELLSDGLTFDLVGLESGPAATSPAIQHRFDFDEPVTGSSWQAINLRPGEHILGASGTVPVLKGLLRLARDLTQHFEQVEAVVWPHSESVIGRRFFESTVTAFLEGGAFPALGLVAFNETVDGGLQTVGLAHITGQELRIEPDLAVDKIVATRLAVRLVNQLVLAGAVKQREEVIAPDGRTIRLEPSGNSRFVRVWSC